jgi:hypothetical protein
MRKKYRQNSKVDILAVLENLRIYGVQKQNKIFRNMKFGILRVPPI